MQASRFTPSVRSGSGAHAASEAAVLVTVGEGRALRTVQQTSPHLAATNYTKNRRWLKSPGAASWQSSVPLLTR
ncbi:hypothetical protein NOVOSPHI9U_310071 [Novosphingobium sp. 9U]|nr:hypothetical protein NOVOSPHI9U_310071 [Novosphingobium sp. 9U]